MDDIHLLVVGKFPNTVSGLIQRALHTVEMWCDEIWLLVNPDKTGLVGFTRRKLPQFFEPCLFGMTSGHSMLVKYLGVILDLRLTWREHMDAKVRKAHNLLWACRRACGVMWSLRPKAAHWLCISIITPSLLLHPWYGGLAVRQLLPRKKLCRVQRLACLRITGVMCTTPTNAVEALICLPPLELVVPGKLG